MRILVSISLALVAALAACAASTPQADDSVPRLRVQVLATLPHDTSAFTEGLELDDGLLYEGTGLVGKSEVRAGLPGRPPTVRATLPGPLFGEGITVVGSRLWQLTWQNGIAIERDAHTLAELRQVAYQGEGWGLCHQQDRLVMSNGSDQLTFRDPATFASLGTVAVHAGSQTFDQLNELECVGDSVYANVWQTDTILRIDPANGEVTGLIDAAGLLTDAQRQQADVLNGIAAIPGTDEFLITGKLWPELFRVKFVGPA
ncbi:glutaminyl-peptide cyclotransferase [Amycolatopsis acidiphila]|uniref:Glutaminyl-peptide cyclotransferase n=1 Tax=Amycolatopsis acidiphila TaxID=715473 RepID=A0A558AJW9_9PSEU|nr:glutaminyl-peptide cyclotransferase [Amycolatopsis acidiphila]TVT24491.1 glutaminyl-peptide cyclotransferase [Amycolatopsis acidiphila]UIJ59298.1 glutaminyl-peptide cyclotransferase [Amycolatopsis acidiphila]GHG79574.1 glutaminyl-peptide cyclotransferase [Amycolatopsis acidiphila]